LYKVSRRLHAHFDERTIFSVLKEKTRNCGRAVKDSELARQIQTSRRTAWCPDNPQKFANAQNLDRELLNFPQAAPIWPSPDIESIQRIVSQRFLLATLREYSPIKFDSFGDSQTEQIIDAVWPGNPLLCCGKTSYQFATRRRDTWRGHLSRCAYIVPNPMLRVSGLTQEGKVSEHTKEATAARVYQVIEFDFSEFTQDGVTETVWAPLVREWHAAGITVADACAALHLHLSVARPLVLVTYSGGKSLHGWYACFDLSEEQNRQFMTYAVRLGADPHTWLRSQFVRMPDGTRENSLRQTVHYFDPDQAVKL
jgi:hypothetical protein